MSKRNSLLDFFEDLEDPRRNKCKKHLLLDIVAISVCGVICGAESWDEIEDYGSRVGKGESHPLNLSQNRT